MNYIGKSIAHPSCSRWRRASSPASVTSRGIHDTWCGKKPQDNQIPIHPSKNKDWDARCTYPQQRREHAHARVYKRPDFYIDAGVVRDYRAEDYILTYDGIIAYFRTALGLPRHALAYPTWLASADVGTTPQLGDSNDAGIHTSSGYPDVLFEDGQDGPRDPCLYEDFSERSRTT
jgi:hypothetical protein